MSVENVKEIPSGFALLHPSFESMVKEITTELRGEQLAELRRDFHARLRITQTRSEKLDWIEDLWDFFYDWCLFERRLPDQPVMAKKNPSAVWSELSVGNERGLYQIQKVGRGELKLKELFTGNTVTVHTQSEELLIGVEKGDVIECRLTPLVSQGSGHYCFVRRPSYHPVFVHDYLKRKVKQFKKAKDFSTYQSWLWLLVGMYLKHQLYKNMPIEKIYDDNSRI